MDGALEIEDHSQHIHGTHSLAQKLGLAMVSKLFAVAVPQRGSSCMWLKMGFSFVTCVSSALGCVNF